MRIKFQSPADATKVSDVLQMLERKLDLKIYRLNVYANFQDENGTEIKPVDMYGNEVCLHVSPDGNTRIYTPPDESTRICDFEEAVGEIRL